MDKLTRTPDIIYANNELQVLSSINNIEIPFMSFLHDRFSGNGDGYWRMCGLASTALSRIVSAQTGVPIGLNLPGEHIELAVGIYDPVDDIDRLDKMEEQTYIRYHVGNGDIYYIDPIYGMLILGKSNFEGAIQVEKYNENTIDNALMRNHNLHPFDKLHPDLDKCGTFQRCDGPESCEIFYNDLITSLNDRRAIMREFMSDSGQLQMTSGRLAIEIIKKFLPEWEE